MIDTGTTPTLVVLLIIPAENICDHGEDRPNLFASVDPSQQPVGNRCSAIIAARDLHVDHHLVTTVGKDSIQTDSVRTDSVQIDIANHNAILKSWPCARPEEGEHSCETSYRMAQSLVGHYAMAPQLFQSLGKCEWQSDLVALYRTSWETGAGQPLPLPVGWQWRKSSMALRHSGCGTLPW